MWKLPTQILLEVSFSTNGDGIRRISSSPSATYHIFFIVQVHSKILSLFFLSELVFYSLSFITRNLIILFFLPLLSSTLPKSEHRVQIRCALSLFISSAEVRLFLFFPVFVDQTCDCHNRRRKKEERDFSKRCFFQRYILQKRRKKSNSRALGCLHVSRNP